MRPSYNGPRYTRVHRTDRAQVAGIEAVLVGFLVILIGTLVMVNVWSRIHTRMLLSDAAHEFLRAYTAPGLDREEAAVAAGHRRLDESLTADGRDPRQVSRSVRLAPDFGPCAEVTLTLTTRTPAVRVPMLGDIGADEVVVSRRELLPPAGQRPGPGYARRSTPCYAD